MFALIKRAQPLGMYGVAQSLAQSPQGTRVLILVVVAILTRIKNNCAYTSDHTVVVGIATSIMII